MASQLRAPMKPLEYHGIRYGGFQDGLPNRPSLCREVWTSLADDVIFPVWIQGIWIIIYFFSYWIISMRTKHLNWFKSSPTNELLLHICINYKKMWKCKKKINSSFFYILKVRNWIKNKTKIEKNVQVQLMCWRIRSETYPKKCHRNRRKNILV